MSGKNIQKENQVELKDFITGVLVSIVEGVSDANSEFKGRTEYSGDSVFLVHNTTLGDRVSKKGVEFDVAISVSRGISKSGRAGISLSVLKANIGNDKDNTHEQTHRIKFNIGIQSYMRTVTDGADK